VTRNRRNRLIVAVAVPLVLVAIIYAIVWQALADRWRTGMAQWIASAAASGWTISTGAVTVSGFPGALRLSLLEPMAADAAGNRWQGPPAAILVSPFEPLTPRFEAPGRHLIAMSGRAPIEITAESLGGRLAIEHGTPIGLWLAGTKLAGLGMALEGLTLEAHRPPAPTAEGQIPIALAATLGLDRLTVPETLRVPFGRTVVAAHLAIRLRGDLPKGATASALAEWRDGGGTLEIDSLDIGWPPMAAAGNATVALDKSLQPELAGTVTVRGGGGVIDRAGAAGMIKPEAAVVAKLALAAASKPAGDGAPEAKVAIGIQNRVLSVGSVPVLQLPEVTW
jgi:hypothetical protein